ncbi:MAG: hypothetical protein NTY50_02050 [Methylobacter sp.]|nr:hypothetical protein [Methylobacter sp.]
MRYTAYNLSIDSEIDLPELFPMHTSNAEPADVKIHFGSIAPEGLADGQQLGPFLWATPESLWLQVPQVARFLISNGNAIRIAPEPCIDQDSIRVFLLGSVFGALLLQRGHLVLHGNAIRIGDQCMVCVGRSGAGKSTLAAGFLQRGYEILADDVVPVDNDCRAVPGFPRIKLWQNVAERLNIDTAGLSRIRPNLEKFNYPITLAPGTLPLPIRWIYILGRNNVTEEFLIEPIQGLQRFQPLRNNTYRVRFLDGMGLRPEHMKQCGQLANRIRLARVARPNNGFMLDRLIDRLLADIAENP